MKEIITHMQMWNLNSQKGRRNANIIFKAVQDWNFHEALHEEFEVKLPRSSGYVDSVNVFSTYVHVVFSLCHTGQFNNDWHK